MKLFFLDPIKLFEDKEIIKYMCKRLSKEKASSFSDIRYLLWEKYDKFSNCNELQNEKDGLALRKVALENTVIENGTVVSLSVLAMLISILGYAKLGEKFNYLFTNYYILPTIIIFLLFYEYKSQKRAREIVYCTLALEVINEIQSRKF